MSSRKRIRGEGAFGTIVGIAVVVLVGIALFKIIPLHYAGNKVKDAMSEQANFAGVKPLEKIQYEIFVVAQEAGTPLTLQDIKLRRHGNDVIVEAKYIQKTSILGYQYTYAFDHTVHHDGVSAAGRGDEAHALGTGPADLAFHRDLLVWPPPAADDRVSWAAAAWAGQGAASRHSKEILRALPEAGRVRVRPVGAQAMLQSRAAERSGRSTSTSGRMCHGRDMGILHCTILAYKISPLAITCGLSAVVSSTLLQWWIAPGPFDPGSFFVTPLTRAGFSG